MKNIMMQDSSDYRENPCSLMPEFPASFHLSHRDRAITEKWQFFMVMSTPNYGMSPYLHARSNVAYADMMQGFVLAKDSALYRIASYDDVRHDEAIAENVVSAANRHYHDADGDL
jgi:hypothetical protein